jgi:hypothetical protein
MSHVPIPPPPPRYGDTPQLYLTPQIKKRRDGLVPSYFDLSADPKKYNPGGLCKYYRSNSNLLLQIKNPPEGKTREEIELQTVVDNVKNALNDLVADGSDVVSCDFIPHGCTWKLEINPNLGQADENFRLEVQLLVNEIHGVTNYVVDTLLIPKGDVDLSPLAPPLKGYREAKQTFDIVGIEARKAIVRLEFPEFPEGCKGRAFRDVYQLNARVSF